MKKLEIIDDARDGWKFWSVRLNVLGSLLLGLLTIWPESALYFWGAMPGEVKSLLPDSYAQFIALFIFLMSIAARFLKQRKLDEKRK